MPPLKMVSVSQQDFTHQGQKVALQNKTQGMKVFLIFSLQLYTEFRKLLTKKIYKKLHTAINVHFSITVALFHYGIIINSHFKNKFMCFFYNKPVCLCA